MWVEITCTLQELHLTLFAPNNIRRKRLTNYTCITLVIFLNVPICSPEYDRVNAMRMEEGAEIGSHLFLTILGGD